MLCRLVFIYSTIDVDECAVGASDCGANADCVNSEGSYNCICKPGFTGNETFCSGKYTGYRATARPGTRSKFHSLAN